MAGKVKAPQRENWKKRALAAEHAVDVAKYNAASEALRQIVRERDALKARMFTLQSENSPWVRQNNAIRKVVEAWCAQPFGPAPHAAADAMTKIATILDIPT